MQRTRLNVPTRNKTSKRKKFYSRDFDDLKYQVSKTREQLTRARRLHAQIKQCQNQLERGVNTKYNGDNGGPKPIRPWERSKIGTVNGYAGILSQKISLFSGIIESDADQVLDEIRERE